MTNHSTDQRLPPGYSLVPARTIYLEMKARPSTPPAPPPAGCAIRRWRKPGTAPYRELFAAVGGPWGWSGRLIMEKEKLEALIQAQTTEICRLHCEGKVAGLAELDRSADRQVELSYFGLLPGFIGRGLGKFFLDRVVRRAWQGGTERVWLHTCQYDHAGAMAVYLKAGFRVFAERVEMQPYAGEFLVRSGPAGG